MSGGASMGGTQRSKISGAVAIGAGDGQSTHSAFKKKMQEKAEQEASSLWQHPFVDVLKQFKLLPGNDWKQNKKAGEVSEYFAKEIGRRALNIEGTISSNNYVMMPNTGSHIKSLGLNGRYVYFQVKCAKHGLPFSYHIDLGLAERSHGVRISISNLFKNFDTSNGFVAQVPLELRNNCWSVIVIDLYEILKQSAILPSTYLIEGSYQVRSMTVCANTHLRGIFTSDNMYDFVTLPADMRFKFAFDLTQWPEYFHWQTLPADWSSRTERDENLNLQALISKNQSARQPKTREETREDMKKEIDSIIQNKYQESSGVSEIDLKERERQEKYEAMQNALNMQFNKGGPAEHPLGGKPPIGEEMSRSKTLDQYRTGQFSGQELTKSHKLNKDPIMELKHIIGYQPEKCMNMKWSRQEGENVVVFTSGGTLIAMDTETNQQKRFFFGHSAPISCFDINSQGTMLASAQEGSNAIIRVWEYSSARSITFTLMPVSVVKCLSFSHCGKYLAGCGQDRQGKNSRELIVVYDISKITRGEKPEIVAKQTSEFNILCLKFSPIDSTRLASCGKENIRFWRIKEQGNIRGSAVVLNHHARDTVFTCLDFEHGFMSADKAEDEAMKRVFVGTKHGMVYQINYAKETHENQFKTNDGAIFSIAVNDAFCVTGSEDSFLRVWPLDFQEFFMEAQHEGIVNAVDISPDGLRVVCGTMYGSIGVLDKSNQAYKTLLRSHTGNIMAIDFHKTKQNIISISEDRTIRLWSTESMDEVYEFSSPVDQPLSISAHPHLPLFACGFETGKMRIFNIDSTEVTEEFSQFDKALKSLSYDNTGKLLVACCIDGRVSIHNALRQHLPVKMMNLQFQPEFVHVAITDRILSDPDCLDQKFALMGDYGNNINIYDSDTFMIQHQINVNSVVRSFQFSNNNQDLVVVTKDCRIRFYSLFKFEGIFLREVANCHRGSISSMAITSNSGYFLTGGEDNLIKIWDYEAQKTHPYYFQSFIGHTYPVTAVIFNPMNNGQIITVGQQDGIFIWEFNGEIEQDFNQTGIAGQDLPAKEADSQRYEHHMSKLEKIRTTNKAKKQYRNQMAEDSFIIPEFRDFSYNLHDVKDEVKSNIYEAPIEILEKRIQYKLTYNHYADCTNKKLRNKPEIHLGGFIGGKDLLEQKLVNGYDGFGGVHDNLIWNVNAGITYFTLNNKLIIENTKTRDQHIICDSSVQLSCLAMSSDFKMIAVGEGFPASRGMPSYVYMYNAETRKLMGKLNFHHRGIQSICFIQGNRYLATLGGVGYRDEDDEGQVGSQISLWDFNEDIVVGQQNVDETQNQIKSDPHADGEYFHFFTVGNNASLYMFRSNGRDPMNMMSVMPHPKLQNKQFLSLDFTPMLPSPVDTYYILIGADDGSIVTFLQGHPGDPETGEGSVPHQYVNLGQVSEGVQFIEGQVGHLSIKSNYIVFCSNQGEIGRYQINGSEVYPEDSDRIEWIGQFERTEIDTMIESAIVAASFDAENKEGLIGTESGQVFYVNFEEGICIRLIASTNAEKQAITYCKFDSHNTNLIISGCGKRSEEFKIYSTQNLDMVRNFKSNFELYGHVVFVIAPKQTNRKKFKLVGYSKGFIKRVSLEKLKIDGVIQLQMNVGEQITCGIFSENERNVALGSTYGNVYIASVQANGKKFNTAKYCVIPNLCKSNRTQVQVQEKMYQRSYNIDLDSDQQVSQSQSLGDLEIEQSQCNDELFVGITAISFPHQDPIGTMLVAFDDGSIKIWQSVVKNEQLMKILELKQQIDKKEKGPVMYDISQVGYQQFDMIDSFNLFENPNELPQHEIDDGDLRELYGGKKHNVQAEFAPDRSLENCYFAFSESLQFIICRNFVKGEKHSRINLPHFFPTCMKIIDATKIRLTNEDSRHFKMTETKLNEKSSKTFLCVIGTLEGKILVQKIGGATSTSSTKLFKTKVGIAHGGITSIDVSVTQTSVDIIAGSESGEMLQYDLFKKLNDEPGV